MEGGENGGRLERKTSILWLVTLLLRNNGHACCKHCVADFICRSIVKFSYILRFSRLVIHHNILFHILLTLVFYTEVLIFYVEIFEEKACDEDSDSSAGDADNSDEVHDEKSQASDKFYYTSATMDNSKVSFYNESYFLMGFTWTGESSCPILFASCVANDLQMQ
jgi:hypothetical protein